LSINVFAQKSKTPPAKNEKPVSVKTEVKAETVVDIVKKNPDFSILAMALERADLLNALETTQNLTVFAPNNAAFAATGLSEEAIKGMAVADLAKVLKYHVLGNKVMASDLVQAQSVIAPTLAGLNIFASTFGGKVLINGVSVTAADAVVSNGVIHVIDKVLLPPTKTIAALASETPALAELLKAVSKAELASVLADNNKYFTVFAPVNEGFTAISKVTAKLSKEDLQKVLFAHLSDKVLFAGNINDQINLTTLHPNANLIFTINPVMVKIKEKPTSQSTVKATNIIATNGIIHLIEKVLIP